MEFWEFAKAHLGKLLICHYGWDKGAKTVKIISVAIYSRSNLRLTGLSHDPIFGANYYSNAKKLVMRIKIL